MFAGKTEELMRRLRRAQIAKQKIQIFKHTLDARYKKRNLSSHDGLTIKATAVADSSQIEKKLKPDVEIVAIDEAQFFDGGIIDVVNSFVDRGKRVLVAGIERDFRDEAFGPMPSLLIAAEEVTKLTAICSVCGSEATRNQRLINGKPAKYTDPVVLPGAKDTYEARCRTHFVLRR